LRRFTIRHMSNLDKPFQIIRFTPHDKQYYGASIELPEILLEDGDYVKHTEVKIDLGQSRYGGPVMDLPKGVTPPEEFNYAGQLDLAKFSPHDKTGLLPKTGQLIFFADIVNDTGKVIYADVPNSELVRHVVEHEDDFFAGVLIDEIYPATETLASRFRDPEDDEERLMADGNGRLWDDFAGSEDSKIFGIYTSCQLGQKKIEEISFSDKVLLLQVGEDGFNDEGVFSVLIPRADLEARNFENCEFNWAQS
jgi:hypothetical protein